MLSTSEATGRTSPHPNRSINSSPLPSTSLSHIHIADALARSPDNGQTLDLTHRNLTDAGESGAEELATIGREDLVEDESSVSRIALGYNRLATLPMAFALLSRLRYLNLKNNSFSVFPDVLTVMPSLEILDMSRNKIKRLPSQPGSLTKLRVFSLSRNKLTRLPSYLIEFSQLNILKADHNPLEWPPKSVMEPPGGLEDAQEMNKWVRTVQKWMLEHGSRAGGRKASDESISVEQELDSAIEESYNSWARLPINESDFDAGLTPHARSFSVDSELSIYSDISHAPRSAGPSNTSPLERPPPLHLGNLPAYVPPSPSHSPDSYLPTPDESTSSADEGATAVLVNVQQREHLRGASYAGGIHGRKRNIPGKKSLPDLRTAQLNFVLEHDAPEIPQRGQLKAPDTKKTDFSLPSPLSQRANSGSSEERSIMNPPVKPFAHESTTSSPTSVDRPVPSMESERNSYFRRLSTLPTSTVANTLPHSLLSFIDAARGILFAVTQVYQTLQHYTIYAIDDRLSSVLRKVLDPSSTYMMQLINTLDRFDVMSRKTMPSPAVCRSVVESCRDTVAVFGKAVSVLALQLKVLATHDDVRYLRQMLLVLYGATAEISHAWQAMIPHIETVKPFLRESRPPLVVKPHTVLSPRAGSAESQPASAPPTSSLFQAPSGALNTPILRSRSTQPGTSISFGRTHNARRHAGSFSSKDVEIGKKLPSYDVTPQLSAGVVNGHTPTLRGTLPLRTLPLPTTPSSASTITGITPLNRSYHAIALPSAPLGRFALPWSPHSRQGSQSSIATSSASASVASSPSIPSKPPALELPHSRTLVDKQALDAMKLAVEAAPAVWDMVDEIFDDDPDMKANVQQSLESAKSVTERLRGSIRAVQEGNPSADRKNLRDDAHVFVKAVVQLSNIIKNYGGAQTVSSVLRSNMVKLTNSTEEFVILLHVSSFSPSSSRLYSPMISSAVPHTPQGSLLGTSEDNRLGSNLSRSRSAQPSVSSKLAMPMRTRELPRSALPTQSFKITSPPRIGTRDFVQVEG